MLFEELKDLKCGDQIIMKDPLTEKPTPYVLMSIIKDRPDYYFISGYGASLMIKDQETIDGFGVELIDNTHPSWNQTLSEQGEEMGKMIDELETLT